MKVQVCFLCKNKYSNTVCNLGNVYPSTFIDKSEDVNKFQKEELALAQCPKCDFVQLTNILPPDSMYREYWYRSNLNNTMVKALEDIVDKTLAKSPKSYKRVMDIGCNTGTLLSFYPDNYFKTGYDPANNLASFAITNCDIFINDYFSDTIHYSHPFDIITSIAMFYDLEDPDKFIESIKKYLCKSGIWVIQMTDLVCTLKANAYDNLCFEHVAYYSLDILNRLLDKHGMEIFDLEYNNVNGSSVRLYIQHIDAQRDISINVAKAMEEEKELLKPGYWKKFNDKIKEINWLTCDAINKMRMLGKTVFGLGASTKGNTFLQMCGLTSNEIPYILEVSPDKFGKLTIGSNIPIISEIQGFKMKPDCLLILPWHFTNFFLERHLDYLKNGGIFLVAMPEPGFWYWHKEAGKVVFLELS